MNIEVKSYLYAQMFRYLKSSSGKINTFEQARMRYYNQGVGKGSNKNFKKPRVLEVKVSLICSPNN